MLSSLETGPGPAPRLPPDRDAASPPRPFGAEATTDRPDAPRALCFMRYPELTADVNSLYGT